MPYIVSIRSNIRTACNGVFTGCTFSPGQRSTTLISESYILAMLPIAHLTSRTDPFDRYCTGNRVLEESYRAVVNAGIRAYQLHTYPGLIQQYFGSEVRRLVHEHQIDMLNGVDGMGRTIGKTLELCMVALGTSGLTVTTNSGEVEIPPEMNVALLLLLDTPQSPDFVPNPASRSEQISQIGMDVDWRFAECLTRGREEITDAFEPILSGTYSARHSPRDLQYMDAH